MALVGLDSNRRLVRAAERWLLVACAGKGLAQEGRKYAFAVLLPNHPLVAPDLTRRLWCETPAGPERDGVRSDAPLLRRINPAKDI